MNNFVIFKMDSNSNELDKIVINQEDFDFVLDVLKEYLESIGDTFLEDDVVKDTKNKLVYVYPENNDEFYFKILEC